MLTERSENISRTQELTVHAYDWKVKDEYDDRGHMVIHAWCFDRNSVPHLLRFHNFPAYCYVELPLFVGNRRISWSGYRAQQVYESICYRLGEDRPFKYFFKRMQKLYLYRGDRRYPMLILLFNTVKSMYKCNSYLKKPFKVRNVGLVACRVWETKITPVRKLLTLRNVKYCQWFSIQGTKATAEEKVSTLDNEYIVNRSTMNPIPAEKTSSWVTKPVLFSFDIETYTDRHTALPDKYASRHVSYMISCVIQRVGEPETREKIIILYGDCNDTDMAKVIRVDTETKMIDAMTDLIKKYDPDVITGYNIFGYDYPYLDVRLKRRLREWQSCSRVLNQSVEMKSL